MQTATPANAELFEPTKELIEKTNGTVLNLGCGSNRIEGATNIDKYAHETCKPDLQFDLEQSPWPIETNSVGWVIANHVLEHLGETTEKYFTVWKELYRVLKHGGIVSITVPHYLHKNFADDPTHVRRITPKSLILFDQEFNKKCAAEGFADSPLGLSLGINFKVIYAEAAPSAEFFSRYNNDMRTAQSVFEKDLTFMNNIAHSFRIIVVAVKE